METFSAVQSALSNHDRRIDANYNSIDRLRSKQEEQAVKAAELRTELSAVREDIAEMKKEFGAQLTWIRRGLWAAASTFTLFVLGLATVIIQVTSG